MTATQTVDLANLLSAKRVALETPPEETVDYIAPGGPIADNLITSDPVLVAGEHGEIVPAVLPAPVAEYEPQYPSIPPKVVGGLPYVRDYMKLARTIHSTEMVPKEFNGRPDAILACFLRGYELGFGPMQSLDSFNVIQGKVGLKPEAMRALIMDNGHEIRLRDVVNGDGKVVAITARCRRSTWEAGEWEEYTYSLEDALLMGLLSKDNWKKQPRAMLDARATAGAGRRYFSDILAGMSYTPEEIRDFTNDQEVSTSASTSPSPTPSAPPVVAAQPPTPEPSTESEPIAPISMSSENSQQADMTPPPAESVNSTETSKKARGSTKKAAAQTEDSDVRLEMRKALTALIGGLEPLQQPLARSYLAQNGYGDVTKLTPEQVQQAIDIVAGWPDSIIVEAEVVEETEPTLDGF